MIGVIAIARAKPGKLEELEQVFLGLKPKVTREPGNRRYDICRYVSEPDSVLLFEEFADQAGLDFHMAAPHVVEAGPVMEPLMVSPIEVKVYQAANQ